MHFPHSLTTYLREQGSALGLANADLTVWVEDGKIFSYPADANEDFATQYDLKLLIQQFGGQPSAVFLLVNRWYKINQPQQLHNDRQLSFEAQINDTTSADLLITLPIEERNQVLQDGQGHAITTVIQPGINTPDAVISDFGADGGQQ